RLSRLPPGKRELHLPWDPSHRDEPRAALRTPLRLCAFAFHWRTARSAETPRRQNAEVNERGDLCFREMASSEPALKLKDSGRFASGHPTPECCRLTFLS